MKSLGDFLASLFCLAIAAFLMILYLGIPALALYAACHFLAKYW